MAEIARQHWSAKRYAETAHFVPALGTPVLELLAPAPGIPPGADEPLKPLLGS